MDDENEIKEELPNERPSEPSQPSLMRNYISFMGMAIVVATLSSVALLVAIELTSPVENAYIGILTYIILPSIMGFGLILAAIGMIVERRRRRRVAPDAIMAYPKLDLNDARTRRSFMTFLILMFFFIAASAFGSYRAFEYTESVQFCGQTCHSVMKPEFMAHKAGAHARVRCVDCHVGHGAGWYARSKLSGAYQLYSVAFDKFSRPITTPVHNLRPAPDTCEQCHWPEKFFGGQMKSFNRYANDERNTLRQTRLLLHVGGGSPKAGQVTGIHWHVNSAIEVSYITTEEHRQEIPWVRLKEADGTITEFYDKSNPISPEQVASGAKRKMDCVDCHNRPAHSYLPPDVAVDNAFTAGGLDPSLPFLKREAVAVIAAKYETNDQALAAIDTKITSFYKTNYPDLYSKNPEVISNTVAEIQRIFQDYFFPEMKTDWQTHPNNVGHLNSVGCFRCHNGNHVSNTGRVIRNECTICHTTIFDSEAPISQNMRTGPFQHPVDLGALASRKCESCHQPDKPFKHPINLGDISMFQCAVCHPKAP